jgi:hypothetical protein
MQDAVMSKRKPKAAANAGRDGRKENRDVPNKVMSTTTERDLWHAAAEAAGLTFSTWARIALQAAVEKR